MNKIDFVVVSVIAVVLFFCVSDVASVTTRRVDDAPVCYSDAEFTQIQDAVDANSYIDAFISDAKAAPEEEWNTIFGKANTYSSTVFTAELHKTEVKRGDSVNVNGTASGTNIVDIVVLGPRGLRRMPASITSEDALADGFRFMTVAVAEDNTFGAEIRIPEGIYSGFQHVMVLSPGEDGVYGTTTRTGGELFAVMQDYIASKGGCEAVLPGKSTEQLVDIIAAATINATGSDDLAVDLTFIGASSFGEVIKLNPIAPRHVGEPLEVTGTAELEDGSVVVVSTIPDPLYLAAETVRVEEGAFSATFDTTDAVPGTYVMQAEDTDGNIDTEPFEVLSSAHATTEQRIGRIKAVEHSVAGVLFDIPSRVVSGETMDVKGSTNTGGNLDIVIDDHLMADDLLIDQHGEFEFDLNTRKPFPNMGAYTPGVSVIKAYSNCHVAGVSVGDHVRTAYKHLEPDGVCAFLFVAPKVTAELNLNSVAKGGYITVEGTARGTDIVDMVIIGPEGLKKMPGSFTSEEAIVDGLFFTSAEVSEWEEFEKSIRIPDEADSGDYHLLIFTSGRDCLYGLTLRDEGELFEALQDYGLSSNDFVGKSQELIVEMLEESTSCLSGSDDLSFNLSFNVGIESPYKTWHVDDDFKNCPDANFSSIQDAVNAASRGDKIIVYNGTYVENVGINKSITIISANGTKNTIVQAKNPNDHVFEVTSDYVNISGFTVEGAGGSGNGKAGIYLYYADYCNISNNICPNNVNGIWLWDSSNNSILNNICLNNKYDDIWLWNSNNNSISNNNICSNNSYGVFLWYSNNNKLTGNIMVENGIFIWGDSLTDYTHEIDESNTVNEKPVYYRKDVEGGTIPGGVGQVILVNCKNVVVEKQILNKATIGIQVAFSSFITIKDNICSKNFDGISIASSRNNSISKNNCSSNSRYGINLHKSNNNSILGNNCSSKNWYSIWLGSSNNNIISKNNCSNNRYGIWLSYSNNNSIYMNNFINNTYNFYSYGSTNIWNSPLLISYTYNGNTYTNYLGNYWGKCTDIDANNDGIWDNPFPIDSDKDYHPLKEPFESYKTVSVPEWRKDIEIGDILYARGGSVLRIEGHVGIYIGNNEVVEARVKPFGVVKRPIETWDNFEATTVCLLRVKCPSETRKDAALFAEGQLGKKWRPMWSWFGKHPDEDSEFWYCSELVWAAYYNQGIDIDKDDLPSMTKEEILSNTVSPTDIRYDDDIEQIGGYLIGKEGVRKGLDFIAHSPVDLIVTDPDGFIISKDSVGIPEAVYLEYDFDEDGYPDDFIGIPARKIGNYLITVIPEPDANITDTYTLEVSTEYTTTVLAENVSICDIPTEPYVFEVIVYFDTGPSENPYPSIMGLHNGTIKPTHDITVNKMYTYSCAGTGGHSESVVFYNSTTGEEIVNGTWGGYTEGNYHRIEFEESFGLHGGVTYNYTIITGSYPQIIHEPVFNTSDGEITCTKFTDANGRVYYDWIPAIKLE